MRFPLAIGAVVEGVEIAFQTPDSGQVSPVRARVPIALRMMVEVLITIVRSCSRPGTKGSVDLETEAH